VNVLKIGFLVLSFFIPPLCGQDMNAHVWIDGFALDKGVVLYPQYSWNATTPAGSFNGYGFIESTPGERVFANNLMIYTPRNIDWFSIHVEVGGFPAHDLGFHQIGPRININEAVPGLKKSFPRLFVAVLPRFIGIRPNNILVAGASKPVSIRNTDVWVEGYSRFFPKGLPYGEYWVMLKRKEFGRFSVGALVHTADKHTYVGFGLRIPMF